MRWDIFDSEVTCIKCGERQDKASEAIGNGTGPQAGDVSVCWDCGHVAIYDDNMKLREMTEDENEHVMSDPNVLSLLKAREEVKGAKPH